jgi:pyruvate formate lyase activating enzyme
MEKLESAKRLGSKSYEIVETVGKEVTVEEIINEIKSDVPFFEESGGGVTLSGGEPLAQPEFTFQLLKSCKAIGIHTAIDTCGYASWKTVAQTIPFTDVYLFDLKIADSMEHKKHTGVENEQIIKNLNDLSAAGCSIIIRIPLVEGITDTPKNIEGLKRVILGMNGIQRIDFLPYHNLAKHKLCMVNKHNQLDKMENYPLSKAKSVASAFVGYGPIISVGG